MQLKKIILKIAPYIIAQMKEGSGSNFTLKFFEIFEIVKYVAFRKYTVSFRNFFAKIFISHEWSQCDKNFREKIFFGCQITKKLQKIEILRKLEQAARCQWVESFFFSTKQWFRNSDRMMQKKLKKFCLGVIFRRKIPKKSIFGHLQLTAVYKNHPPSRLIYYSVNESWWNLL